MNVNLIVSATAVLVGLMVGLIFYLQSQSDDASYLIRSKWSVTTADGTAQTWLVDSESGAISVTSIFGGDSTTEEFFGGKKYTYFAAVAEPFDADAFCAHIDGYDGDCAALAIVQEADRDAMAEAWASNKAVCSVEDFGVSTGSASLNKDGNLSMGGFTVSMVNGSPTAILGGDGSVMATINSFENVEGEISITGCDDSSDLSDDASRRTAVMQGLANIADSRRKLGEGSAEIEKARNYLSQAMMEQMMPEDRDEASRHLGISAWLSNTAWCGAGTEMEGSVACPAAGNPGGIGSYDLNADKACRRHDHGSKHKTIFFGLAVRLACDVDAALAFQTNNWTVQAVFGSVGLAAIWGCK